MPFFDTDGKSRPHLQLEQTGSHDFFIVHGFRYRLPESSDGGYEVKGGKVERTDLASVPFFLQWFVRSYGRHTLAAVLHDHLWRQRRKDAKIDNDAFKDANRVFRIAMDELDVAFVRRWLMWAAVSLAWLSKRELAWKVRVVAWVLAIVGLDAVTAWVLVKDVGAPAAIIAVVLLVASLGLLWPHRVVAAIGVPTLYLLVPSILVVFATLLVFLVAEIAVYIIGWVRYLLARLFNRPMPSKPHWPLLKMVKPIEEPAGVMTVPEVEEYPSSV